METSFQQIVLGIAIVFLIIILVFIGSSLGNSKSKGQWPPKIANCPDYWELDTKSDETKTICNLLPAPLIVRVQLPGTISLISCHVM